MNKEVISDQQAIAIIILFIIGTASIEASGISAKKDLWIAIIIGICISLSIILIYARLHYLFPGKDLFDIIEICFGSYIGKAIIILFTSFVFEDNAETLRNYSQFVNTVALVETPLLIIWIATIILCVWIVKEGIEVIGRWSSFFVIPFIVSVVSTTFLEIPQMDINNIRPILSNGIKPVIKGALETCTFPFLQTIVLTMVLGKFERKDSPFKVYIKGLLIGGTILFIISLTNILTLGINGIERYYFPSHITASRINIRDTLQRIEILPSMILTIGTFIKISIYMIAACKGITKIFRFKDYRFIVVPMSLLMINLSSFEFESMIDYYEFADVWYWYAFPFEVILPIIIWITSEIKKNRER